MDKSLIINEIKKHLGFKKEIDFANFLGINQSTLSAWHKRGSINYELIIAKCKDIDANWLLTGKGQMIRKSKNESTDGGKMAIKEGLNLNAFQQLEKDLEVTRRTISDKEKIIDLQVDLIRSLKSENEILKYNLQQNRDLNL